ncbi:hypothetical protein DNU06_11390 [Putridiphycobacter roseus]|uniref:Calcineurin-like phosphoesterase domain-containing protein n=2 Tax=Putridiphycobacter roseus TaxID=2219161 RepID=A0A2W1NCP9_9FLAO|nr:hypothetical protein DNU06_11390 [Putridiphycobacter roseus]
MSCRKDQVKIEKEFSFVHLSHSRTDNLNELNSEVLLADFSNIDVLCLGGDLMFNSSADSSNLNILDEIFDLSSPSTLWSIGNHDVSDLNLLQAYTQKNLYSAYYFNGITFIVLNTQLEGNSITGDQLAFFNGVMDTMTVSAQCIILHHKLIWLDNNPDLEPIANSISNGPLGNCDYCIAPNNFYTAIYPRLVERQKAGVNITLIGGDIGAKVNEFHHETNEHISFYASGMKAGSDQQQVLYILYNVAAQTLQFSYRMLNTFH